jgi:hypothetical protein
MKRLPTTNKSIKSFLVSKIHMFATGSTLIVLVYKLYPSLPL